MCVWSCIENFCPLTTLELALVNIFLTFIFFCFVLAFGRHRSKKKRRQKSGVFGQNRYRIRRKDEDKMRPGGEYEFSMSTREKCVGRETLKKSAPDSRLGQWRLKLIERHRVSKNNNPRLGSIFLEISIENRLC